MAANDRETALDWASIAQAFARCVPLGSGLEVMMVLTGVGFERKHERQTAAGRMIRAHGREWRKLHGCYSRSEDNVLNVYSLASTAVTTAPWYAKWRLVAMRAGVYAKQVLGDRIPPDMLPGDCCWERAMIWAAEHGRIAANTFFDGAADIDAAIGQWAADEGKAPATKWYHWSDLAESSIELAGLLKRLSAGKAPPSPVGTVVTPLADSSELLPRRGRLSKAESEILRTQLLAELRNHPSLADDPAKLGQLVGVSRVTAWRWLTDERKKWQLLHKRNRAAEDDEPPEK